MPDKVLWDSEITAADRTLPAYTHQLFRFPAKTFPPAARAMVRRYSLPGERIADPFAGSGTIAVEAILAGRTVVASDVDPLSVLVTRAKTTPVDPATLSAGLDRILCAIAPHRRERADLAALRFQDVDVETYARDSLDLDIPQIPNFGHWFQRYAAIDLGRIRTAILSADLGRPARLFFLACFASAIRLSSNADPVPVSGLEVTSYMRARAAKGRVIDVFAIFERRARAAIQGMGEYWQTAKQPVDAQIFQADATTIRSRYPIVDSIITSPPYHGAVDYYRRHTLEMYWLNLTRTHTDRLALKGKYLGRSKVGQRESHTRGRLPAQPVLNLEMAMRTSNRERADAFHHYTVGMKRFFARAARIVRPGGWVVTVVGHSSWNGSELDTSMLLEALAGPTLELREAGSYGAVNRHMSYARHNGASIDREWVLAFKRSDCE